MKKLSCLTACFLILCLNSCLDTKKLASQAGEGFSAQSEAIGRNLVAGMQTSLRDSAFKLYLSHTIDSLIMTASTSANTNFKTVLDSVFNERWSLLTRQLVEDATGLRTRQNITALREAMIGAQTKAQIQALVAAILNDQNTGQLIALRNNLLGSATRDSVTAIADTLMAHFTSRFQTEIADTTLQKLSRFINNDFSVGVDRNLSIFQKYAGWFLWGLGALAAFIIGLIWLSRQKYQKLTTLLASQVNAIPDEQVYNKVTARIKERAVTAGVEPTLRDVLSKNNLLGKESWKPLE